MMRSCLNEGYAYSQPAKAFYRLHEEIDTLNSRLRQAEELLNGVAARLSAIEQGKKISKTE